MWSQLLSKSLFKYLCGWLIAWIYSYTSLWLFHIRPPSKVVGKRQWSTAGNPRLRWIGHRPGDSGFFGIEVAAFSDTRLGYFFAIAVDALSSLLLLPYYYQYLTFLTHHTPLRSLFTPSRQTMPAAGSIINYERLGLRMIWLLAIVKARHSVSSPRKTLVRAKSVI